LTRDNTLALGSSVMTPLELASSYLVFAAGGVKREPVFIKKIIDRDGNVLERHTHDDQAISVSVQLEDLRRDLLATEITPLSEANEAKADTGTAEVSEAKPTKLGARQPGQVISEETAYIMTHLLSEVVRYGTGYRARKLERPAAGKTGTTNDYIDAWFVGYTPDLLGLAWVGFDEASRSLGKLETGAKAASPMWLRFMLEAMEGRPTKAFRVPSGITFVRIDPDTGTLATPRTQRPVLEAFRQGSEPSDKPAQTSTEDFLIGQ
jgi:penicillin-binding protein 1A